MEIKLGLILIACIVNFGLTCVQSPSQVVHQAVFNKGSYKREIRENLQNLFDSISVHDSEKSGAYHEFLNKGIVKEQEAFDAMKEELRFARSTNINKRKKIDENVAVMKREANVNNSSSATSSSANEGKQPEYCTELKRALQDYDMDGFVKAVNDQYKVQYSAETFPQSNEQCRETLNIILGVCSLDINMDRKIKRVLTHEGGEWKNRTIYTHAGVVDILLRNYSESTNLVVKLRYNKRRACIPFSQVLKYFEQPNDFTEKHPEEQQNILALSFKAGGDPAIDEWISILYRDGDIVNAQHKAPCLQTPEFSDLKYKDKVVNGYFNKGTRK